MNDLYLALTFQFLPCSKGTRWVDVIFYKRKRTPLFVLPHLKRGTHKITPDLCLAFQIPESAVTINGLIRGLKETASEIHRAILADLMRALEERVIEGRTASLSGIQKASELDRSGY